MLVPKAAMNKDGLFLRAPDDIGLARQLLSMKTESITQPMNVRTYKTFGFHVARSDAPHIFGAAFNGQLIDQCICPCLCLALDTKALEFVRDKFASGAKW